MMVPLSTSATSSSSSPFTEEHKQLRDSIRAFVRKEIVPHVEAWERDTFPDAAYLGWDASPAGRRLGE